MIKTVQIKYKDGFPVIKEINGHKYEVKETIGYRTDKGQYIDVKKDLTKEDIKEAKEYKEWLKEYNSFNDVCSFAFKKYRDSNEFIQNNIFKLGKEIEQYKHSFTLKQLAIHLKNDKKNPHEGNIFVINSKYNGKKKFQKLIMLIDIDNKNETKEGQVSSILIADYINKKFLNNKGHLQLSSSGNGVHLYFMCKNNDALNKNNIKALKNMLKNNIDIQDLKCDGVEIDSIYGEPTVINWNLKKIESRGNVLRLPRDIKTLSFAKFKKCSGIDLNRFFLGNACCVDSLVREGGQKREEVIKNNIGVECLSLERIKGQTDSLERKRMFCRYYYKYISNDMKYQNVLKEYLNIDPSYYDDEKQLQGCLKRFDSRYLTRGIKCFEEVQYQFSDEIKEKIKEFKRDRRVIKEDQLKYFLGVCNQVKNKEGIFQIGQNNFRTLTNHNKVKIGQRKMLDMIKFLKDNKIIQKVNDSVFGKKCNGYKLTGE